MGWKRCSNLNLYEKNISVLVLQSNIVNSKKFAIVKIKNLDLIKIKIFSTYSNLCLDG